MLAAQEIATAPAGLKFAESLGFRFWIRPQNASFGGMYAVSVRSEPHGIVASAFPVVGYMGDFAFDWSLPEHAMSLVLSVVPGSQSLRMFKDVACKYGQDWLLTNATNERAAIDSDDASFMKSWVHGQFRYKGLKGVYFASNGRGSVKIGKTDSCLLSRLRSLQVSSPDELRVVAFVSTPNASQVEAEIHAKHKASRIRGEWFAMTDGEAVASAVNFGGIGFDEFLG
ncbi:MAG: GIY-YIG nuclease family protein [Caulobacteraceae bacterium]|nr:GIY-YIG nuclease family protein [Caulobacteraceae bacterium]